MAKASRKSRSSPAPRSAAVKKAAGPHRLAPPGRPTNAAKTFTSKPVAIDFAGPEHRFARADLEISGIYHAEASYEGRVFLNNPQANADTPCDRGHGYAGSFHIFGHGGCVGDAGHCEINEHGRDPYDWRPPHPLTPAKKRIKITEALREVAKNAKEATITIVPIVNAATDLCDTSDVFKCEQMRFVTYNG